MQAWEQSEDPAVVEKMRRATDVLLRRLDLVSRRMPLSLPIALRLMGMRECLDGNPQRGEKLLRKSIAAAVRLGMPIDEGIGEYELARRAASVAEQRIHINRARAVLQRIGCEIYLDKIGARKEHDMTLPQFIELPGSPVYRHPFPLKGMNSQSFVLHADYNQLVKTTDKWLNSMPGSEYRYVPLLPFVFCNPVWIDRVTWTPSGTGLDARVGFQLRLLHGLLQGRSSSITSPSRRRISSSTIR